MNEIIPREIETERLILKRPTMEEQYGLWTILKEENVNKLYMPTPGRFNNNRKAFQESLNNWEKQKPFYQKKIDTLNDNSNMYTWSIFLKNGEVIGQMTVQPKDEYPNNPKIRDVGWFINPVYHGQGYAYETAKAILDFMFEEVEIEKIVTSAAQINPASWLLMEKLGLERTGEKQSPYQDENNQFLLSYTYEITREKYISKNKEKIKK